MVQPHWREGVKLDQSELSQHPSRPFSALVVVASSLRTGGHLNISGTLMRSKGRVVDSHPHPWQPRLAAGCEGSCQPTGGVHLHKPKGSWVRSSSKRATFQGPVFSVVPRGWSSETLASAVRGLLTMCPGRASEGISPRSLFSADHQPLRSRHHGQL